MADSIGKGATVTKLVVKFRKNDILDFSALSRTISGVIQKSGKRPCDPATRPELMRIFREAMETGKANLKQFHLQGASGQFVVRGRAYLMDSFLRRLYTLVQVHFNDPQTGKGVPFSLIATGGYGRGELAPYSDIDLLFLLPEGIHPGVGMQVEKMLYFLWDLGLEVGHAVRNLEECIDEAKKDVEIRTSLLESRFLAGDRRLFYTYRSTLFDQVLLQDPAGFQRAKLIEQRKRHERFGNSLFYLEPNIKENPGGQRDIHTFFWISKYRYRVGLVKELIPRGVITPEEYRTFTRCREFFWRVRNALHYQAGRKEDRLTFHLQLAIAEEFGYRDRPGIRGVEQFMRRYYQVARQVNNLSQIFLLKYEEDHQAAGPGYSVPLLEDVFLLVGDKVAVGSSQDFRDKPVRMMRLFEVAQRHVKSIHPEAMRWVSQNLNLVNNDFRRNPEVNEIFLQMLNGKVAVAWVLRKMNMCGLLGRYIPEFGRIIGQTQHDLFHVYTVDEHTILAVEALRHIKRGDFTEELPISTKLMNSLRNPVKLYLAVMLHDIAKGRKGQHEIKGAVIARQVCQRLGLNRQDVEMVSWLVEYHLVFSRTAFRRDLSDPQTVTQFARMVGDVKKLELLLLLTVADIRAVGPGVWNQWKAVSLRRLFRMAAEVLNKGLFEAEQLNLIAQQQKEAVQAIFQGTGQEGQVMAYLNRFYPDYFLGYEPETLAEHYFVLSPHMQESLAVVFLSSSASESTDMIIHLPDHPGIIALISGALAAEGANILAANINTTKDGMALDIFTIQDSQGQPIEARDKRQSIIATLKSILTGKKYPDRLLAEQNDPSWRKREHFQVATTVDVDNKYSDMCTILEVSALDRRGLLYTITRELVRQGIQIRSAKIATYGEKAVDVFYIRDQFGLKIYGERLQKVTNGLIGAIDRLSQPAG
ncbi:MAG: [protein-PII] uridylyltransferase [Magnetococcales bacterium]|nr:[protein-PII] uridylyltransferase [Magnetococcales bacterium]NGZ25343.1 [protein-PII] uridylyltransferase [Magnetococcales bacterium]